MKQADYVASRLTGGAIASEWHNVLKLGFDVRALRYPEWLTGGEIGEIARGRLPRVVRPGEPIGPVSDKLVAKCVRQPAHDSVEGDRTAETRLCPQGTGWPAAASSLEARPTRSPLSLQPAPTPSVTRSRRSARRSPSSGSP